MKQLDQEGKVEDYNEFCGALHDKMTDLNAQIANLQFQ
jgi:hypothetical protein